MEWYDVAELASSPEGRRALASILLVRFRRWRAQCRLCCRRRKPVGRVER